MRWFISDHHFGHKNIIKYCSRPFKSVEEMDAYMIAKWNGVVKPDDEVFYVGDFSFHCTGRTEEIARSLNGFKHLIVGNHDERRSKQYWRKLFVTVQDDMKLLMEGVGRFVYLTHYPVYGHRQPQIVIHGHSHNYRPLLTTYTTTKQLLFNVSVENVEFTPLSEIKILNVIEQHEKFLAGEQDETASDSV